MSSTEKEDDFMLQNSEWEGMVSRENEDIYSIYRLLGKIRVAYLANSDFKFLVDAFRFIEGEVSGEDKEKIGLLTDESLKKEFQDFLTDKDWQELENIEKERTANL